MIDHVNFQMPERVAHECAPFYELLGFARVEPPKSLAGSAIWLASGDTAIHLQFAGGDGAEVASTGDAGPGHVAIVVGSRYASLMGLFAAAGVTVEPRSEHWGSPRCYVRDPAGNRLELMESAPRG